MAKIPARHGPLRRLCVVAAAVLIMLPWSGSVASAAPTGALAAAPVVAQEATCDVPLALSVAISSLALPYVAVAGAVFAAIQVEEQWCQFSQKEKDLCGADWATCALASAVGLYASWVQTQIVDDSGANGGRQDAARPCVWQLALAARTSAAYAEQWGWAHESRYPHELLPNAMDLHNNQVARGYRGAVIAAGGLYENTAKDRCTTLDAAAVHVGEVTGVRYTTDDVDYAELAHADPYNGSFTNRLVYIGSQDTRSPWTPDWTLPVVNVTGGGAFRSKYDELAQKTGPLGSPTAAYQSITGGQRQAFGGSSCGGYGSAILWSGASGTHQMQGCIYRDYLASFGGFAGQFGFPTSDEQDPPGGSGRVNYMSGSPCTSAQAQPRSALYYRSATGATFGVKGCLFVKYRALGETASGLGYPTSLEISTSQGIRQNFQSGYMIWANGTASVYYDAGAPVPGTITVDVMESNTASCPGTNQYFSTNDYSGVPISWTWANGNYPCIRVHYGFTPVAALCDYQFYVPNGFATATIKFSITRVVNNQPQPSITAYLNEEPVTGWTTFLRNSNVAYIEFTDANGQTGKQIGWGRNAEVRRICTP
jgi:hypothetical protein